MGIIYKLKPEVISFILESKKAEPKLSCRGMAALIENKFQTKVSKSSINALFKEKSLSMPVGRRRTKRKYTLKLKGVIAAPTKELAAPLPPIPEPIPAQPQEVSKPIEMPAPPTEARAEEEARREAEAEAKAKAKAKAEAEEKARREAEEKARLAAELKAKLEAQIKAKEEAEAEAEAKAKREAEEKVRKEAEERARKEAAEKARREAEERARREVEEKARIEAELSKRKAREIVQTEGVFAGLGAIFLKAADYLLGGSYFITEAIKSRLKSDEGDLLAKTECLIYSSLFKLSAASEPAPDCGLWPLVNAKFTREALFSYLNKLQEVNVLPLDVLRTVTTLLQEVRGIKVSLSDGGIIYLDGQLHTVWSAVHIPYDFSTTIYNIKSYIKKSFQEDAPFLLFTAPGYDLPTKEFFDFMSGLEDQDKRILSLTLYGNKFEEIETIRLEQAKKRNFIFGLWPWQFAAYRQVKILGEFRPFHFAPLKKDFYLANVEMDLMQPSINKRVTLRGCALKTSVAEKIRLLILSNLVAEQINLEELATTYLNRWPNLEEAFQDYSRKIELFTYTASSQRFFSTESLDLNKEAEPDIEAVFNYYLKALDLYVKRHFLPLGYEDKDFPTIKDQFYDLRAGLKPQETHLLATFQPLPGYLDLKDLEYACRRVNEKEVFLNGKRLWLSI